jgi:hypothetical protein
VGQIAPACFAVPHIDDDVQMDQPAVSPSSSDLERARHLLAHHELGIAAELLAQLHGSLEAAPDCMRADFFNPPTTDAVGAGWVAGTMSGAQVRFQRMMVLEREFTDGSVSAWMRDVMACAGAAISRLAGAGDLAAQGFAGRLRTSIRDLQSTVKEMVQALDEAQIGTDESPLAQALQARHGACLSDCEFVRGRVRERLVELLAVSVRPDPTEIPAVRRPSSLEPDIVVGDFDSPEVRVRRLCNFLTTESNLILPVAAIARETRIPRTTVQNWFADPDDRELRDLLDRREAALAQDVEGRKGDRRDDRGGMREGESDAAVLDEFRQLDES